MSLSEKKKKPPEAVGLSFFGRREPANESTLQVLPASHGALQSELRSTEKKTWNFFEM